MWLSLVRPFFVWIWCAPGFTSLFATEDTKGDVISVYSAGEPETQLCFRALSPHHGHVESCLSLAFEEPWDSGGYADLHGKLFEELAM